MVDRQISRGWVMLLVMGTLAGSLHAADPVPAKPPRAAADPAPEWSITVGNPILQFKADAPVKTTLTINYSGKETLGSIAWEQQPARINPFAATGRAQFSQGSRPRTFEVVLPTPGVYQLQATLQFGRQSSAQKTWIHVWDSVPATWSKPDGHRPEMAPPPSVRTLSRDPGPFQHPRLLVTEQDWPEIAQRNQTGKVASAALRALRQLVAERFDNPNSEIGRLAVAANQYAMGQGPMPELGGSTSGDPRVFYGMLWNAAYLNWVEGDPHVPTAKAPPAQRERGQALARITSAMARAHFAHIWDRKENKPKNSGSPWFMDATNTGVGVGNDLASGLVFAYDFVYRWMTEDQRRDTRDFLFALGFGRRTSPAFHGDAPRHGSDQNGDFGNAGDNQMLPGLAVEGEDGAVSPDVLAYFGNKTQRWMGPADPKDPSAWPGAWQASVDNLWRQVRWMSSENLRPQGYVVTGPSYYGLTMRWMLWPLLALSRRGENEFITTNFYQSAMCEFHITHPGCDGKLHVYAHQDGEHGTDWRVRLMWKYLYPDDPLVDYIYQYQAGPDLRGMDPAVVSMFGVDPGVNGKPTTLEDVAKAKGLPLITFDPFQMAPVVRNSWQPDDLTVRWTCGAPFSGHNQHAETNSFSLYALGRAWASPPGYHIVPNDLQTAILIQDPRFLSDKDAKGYLGMAQSSATLADDHSYGQPPPGVFIGLAEDPKGQWALMAGDASPAYNSAGGQPYNPVAYAMRTLLFVRGRNPYLLVVDDIRKDDRPQNYRWIMSNSHSFGSSGGKFLNAGGQEVNGSMILEPGATAERGVLFHECDTGKARRPSLLVQELGLQLAAKPAVQPAMLIDRTSQCYGREINRPGKPISYAAAHRLMIDRNQMVSPGYTLLLYPFMAGDPQPAVSWSKDQKVLTIKHGGTGVVDAITFDRTNPDHRTRLAFSRK